MTKIRKKKVLTDRKVKSAKSRAKSAERRAQSAKIEAQNVEMEAQIAEINARRAESDAQFDEEIAAIRAQYEEDRVAAPPAPTYAPTADDAVAQLNAQMEAMQEKLALLQEAAPASGMAAPASGIRVAQVPLSASLATSSSGASGAPPETGKVSNRDPEASSLKPQAFPQARTQLAKPVITSVFAINPTTIVINWLPVEGAESYNLRIGTNEEVTPYLLNTTCSASAISLTLSGLDPDTQYWVAMRTHAVSPDTNSNYTYFGPVTTPSAPQPGVVGDLNQWWNGMQALTQNAGELLPQIKDTVLSSVERRRLLGSGVRRYGFIDKVSDVAAAYPQFWPASSLGTNTMQDDLKDYLREIEVLRNMLIWSQWLTRTLGDLRLLAGDEAFRLASAYYTGVRAAARSRVPEAQQVFEMLKLFWKQRNRFADEPTEQEAIRDFKGVLHGTKTGMVAAERTSDTVTKGVKAVVDETRSTRQHGGARIAETERVE